MSFGGFSLAFESYKYTFRMNASHANVTKAEGVHSHTFEICIYIRQFSEDFATYDSVETIILDYLNPYKGMLLNNISPFDVMPPVLENLGEVFFTDITLILHQNGFNLLKLEISESPQRIYSITEKHLDQKYRAILNLAELKASDVSASDLADQNEFLATLSSGKSSLADRIPDAEPPFTEAKILSQEESSEEKSADAAPYSVPAILKPASNVSFIVSVLLMIAGGFLVMSFVKASGLFPLGLDIHGHLFKTDLMFHEILKGNFYPLYTQYWYNGLQPFRYWPPMTYYFMAFLQFLTGGDVMNAYLAFIWSSFTVGGIGWVLWGRKLGRPVLGAFFGLVWFIFPDNLRVFFGEGNLPRMFITMLLPILFYFLWQFVCYRRKKMIIPLIIMMFIVILGHLMISAMVGVGTAIFLLIYSIANKRYRESIEALTGMLLAFAVAGIWVYPSLVGGMAAMASDGTSALMASLSARLSVSLNPFIRLYGGVTELYLGLSIAIIALLGIFLSNRKSISGFTTLIIIILGTTTALTPLIQLLPLSQLFWVRRFVPIAYAFFVISVFEWRKLKKPILVFMCAVILIDAIPSFNLQQYDAKMNVPATVSDIPNSMDTYLLSQAKTITKQRVSLMDLSILGPMPSYAFGTLTPKTQYVFGWAWQGAATASNISSVNESLEKENYLYMFDRNLELGADSVIVDKQQLTGDADRAALIAAAGRVGYTVSGETDRILLFSYPVDSTFGVITRYSGLAIGTTAALIPGILPSFHPGDKKNIDEYTAKELEQYDMVYLSGFFYNDKNAAEKIVREIATAGVKVYIDMSRIPADPLTNRMTFLDVSAQPITFLGSFPELITDNTPTKAKNFAEGYEKWNTVYLTGLTNVGGYSWFNDTKLNFVGTGDTNNITFLGFNMLFHAYTANDAKVKAVFNTIMELDEDTLPKRSIVPIEITYQTNQITIKSDFDNVNTTLAYQDTFRSDEEISSMNNLLIVNKGTTVITMEYPYFAQSLTISIVGLLLESALIYLVLRKNKKGI